LDQVRMLTFTSKLALKQCGGLNSALGVFGCVPNQWAETEEDRQVVWDNLEEKVREAEKGIALVDVESDSSSGNFLLYLAEDVVIQQLYAFNLPRVIFTANITLSGADTGPSPSNVLNQYAIIRNPNVQEDDEAITQLLAVDNGRRDSCLNTTIYGYVYFTQWGLKKLNVNITWSVACGNDEYSPTSVFGAQSAYAGSFTTTPPVGDNSRHPTTAHFTIVVTYMYDWLFQLSTENEHNTKKTYS